MHRDGIKYWKRRIVMLITDLLPEVNVENYTSEFKARLLTGVDKHKEDNELKWLKEIVAFSNTQGGTVYVGVNDTSHLRKNN